MIFILYHRFFFIKLYAEMYFKYCYDSHRNSETAVSGNHSHSLILKFKRIHCIDQATYLCLAVQEDGEQVLVESTSTIYCRSYLNELIVMKINPFSPDFLGCLDGIHFQYHFLKSSIPYKIT